MKKDKIFQKYYKKLVFFGVLKSTLFALCLGFFAISLAALITIPFHLPILTLFIVNFTVLWGMFIFATPVIFLLFFKPTSKMMDREIDKLGLEERVVTMQELQKSDSYIALLQREDAKNKLKSASSKQLKFRAPKYALLVLGCAALLGVFSVSLNLGLTIHHKNVLEQSGGEDIDDPEKQTQYVTLRYAVHEDMQTMGHIEGETEQVIIKGADGQPVTAVPEEGFIFLKWSDDYIYPERWDWNVLEDIDVEAIFIPQLFGGGEEGRPGDEGASGGNQQPGGEEGSQGNDNSGEGGGGEGENQGDDEGHGSEDSSGSGGGESEGDDGDGGGDTTDKDIPNAPGTGGMSQDNSVIDGETDYKSQIDKDYAEKLQEDDSIPPELKELIERYLDSLMP